MLPHPNAFSLHSNNQQSLLSISFEAVIFYQRGIHTWGDSSALLKDISALVCKMPNETIPCTEKKRWKSKAQSFIVLLLVLNR